jgi:hypothetical protein
LRFTNVLFRELRADKAPEVMRLPVVNVSKHYLLYTDSHPFRRRYGTCTIPTAFCFARSPRRSVCTVTRG